MRLEDISQSRYLKKADVGGATGIIVTIRDDPEGHYEEMPSQDGEETKSEYVIYFDELEKGMVLKSLNFQLISKALGSDDSVNWAGQKIILFEDPSVLMKGKVVGGIRVREYNPNPTPTRPSQPRMNSAPAQRPAPARPVPASAPPPSPEHYAQQSEDQPF